MTISWYRIEEEVASDFEVGIHYVRELRQAFMEDGDILVYGGNSRGLGSQIAKVPPKKR